MNDIAPAPVSLGSRAAAWGVHLFTALGGAAGLLAALAVLRGDWEACFAWLGAAVLIDGLDGTFARIARVQQVLPNFDGALLDNLVDFVTYVFVPALFLYAAGLLPEGFAVAAPAAVVVASAYQFAQADAKTADYFFKGFPSYWNIVAFYLLVLDMNPWTGLAVVLVCVILVFVPAKYAYPSRMTRYRAPTLVLTALWAASLVAMWALYPDVPRGLAWGSLAYVAYYGVVSAVTAYPRPAASPRV